MPRPKTIMHKFRINEISAVDRPAQAHARAVIMKRDDTEAVTKQEFREALDDINAEESVDRAMEGLWKLQRALRLAVEEILKDDAVTDKRARIRETLSEYAAAVEAMLASRFSAEAMEKAAANPLHVEAACLLLGSGFAKSLDLPAEDRPAAIRRVRAAWKKANPDRAESEMPEVLKKEATDMPGENQITADDLKKAVDDAVTPLKAELETAKAFGALNDAEKAHYDGLDDAGKADFLKKSSEDRAAVLKRATESDPVIYKAADGTEFRKSDDPHTVKLAKENDDLRKRFDEAEAARQISDLRKRADDEFGHLPGETDAKAKVLKAVGAISDEEVRKAAEAMLKAGEEAIAKGFDTFGVNPAADPASPQAKLEKMAADLRKETPDLTPQQAYTKALETPEGARLYAEVSRN